MKPIKIKAAITRDFHTDRISLFIADEKYPEIDKFWQWDGDTLMSHLELRDEFSGLKLKKGDYIPVEITIKQRIPKRKKNEKQSRKKTI